MASEAITGWKFPGCTRTQRKPRFSLLRTRRFREILRIPRSRESLDSSPIYPEDLRFHAELASQVHANFAPYTFSGSGSQKSAVDNLWETTPSRRCSTGVIIIPHFLLTSSVQRCTIGIERQEMKTLHEANEALEILVSWLHSELRQRRACTNQRKAARARRIRYMASNGILF